MTGGTVAATASPGAAAVPRVRRAWLWLAVGAAIAMMSAASAPTPFYPLLQDRFGFSAVTLTGIFAVYAVTLLGSLLVAGSLSDHLGRRPVVAAGFVVLALSMAVFWRAGSVPALVAARAVQGLATGVLMSTLSSAVVDLEPPGRAVAAAANAVTTLAGMTAGTALSGAVLSLVSPGAARGVVFGGLAVLYLALAAAAWLPPETSPRRPGLRAALLPRAGIPAAARRPFLVAFPVLVAGWATGGLYLSLGSAIALRELGAGRLASGLLVAGLAGSGVVACLAANRLGARAIALLGSAALAAGTLLTLAALAAGSLRAYAAAAVVAGAGMGTAHLGVMRTLTPVVDPARRGEFFAAVYVVSYLAFGVPAVAAGLGVATVGLAPTVHVFGAAVTLLSGLAFALRLRAAPDGG